MNDDFLTADWARDHGRVTETLAGFVKTLAASFEKLNRYQFDAPWRHGVRPRHGTTAACGDR